MLPLLLLLHLPALAQDDPVPLVVRVPLSALRPAEERPPRPPATLLPVDLRLLVTPGAETRLELIAHLDQLEGGPVDLPVIGADLALTRASLDGRPVALPPGEDGWRRLVAELGPGRHTLSIEGTLATPGPSFDLPLMPSPRARVRVAGDLALASPQAVGGRAGLDLVVADRIQLSWRPRQAPTPRPQVIQAEASTALRVDATGIEARAELRYRVAHQPVDTLAFELPATARELELSGPAVAGFTHRGDRVEVQLARPLDGSISLTLSYRADAPGAAGGPAPLPEPVTSSGKVEAGFVTVQAGDQGTVLPLPGHGLAMVASDRVPGWGRGLVDGSPIAAMAITGPHPSLDLRVLELTPADGPPTFVDEARIEVAYAAHGRSLMRCLYQVRNDKSQYLGVDLPPGARLLGVRVAGRVVQTVRDRVDGRERLLIPLEKSVETFRGLVTFPVELMVLAPEAPWDPRGQRTLQLPAVDAPVAEARWELILPPGVQMREVEAGAARRVDEVQEVQGELLIARAVSVEEQKEDLSREAWNQAYSAYKDNEFEAAQGLLDKALELDQDNDAAQALKENVDVLLGSDSRSVTQTASTPDDSGGDEQERRIRAMARAKTRDMANEQVALEVEAERAIRAGDESKAGELLQRYSRLTEKLVQVEDTEVVDQKARLDEARELLSNLGYVEAPKAPEPVPSGSTTMGGLVLDDLIATVAEAQPVVVPSDGWDDGNLAGLVSPDAGELLLLLESVPGAPGDASVASPEAIAYPEPVELAYEEEEAPDPGALAMDNAESFDGGSEDAPMERSGRSYQSEVRIVAGKGAGRGGGNARSSESKAKKEEGRVGMKQAPAASVPASPAQGPPPPPPPPPARGPASAAPVSAAPASAAQMDTGVTAAPLVTDPPRAGQVLRLEQRLLAPGQALAATLTYRSHD